MLKLISVIYTTGCRKGSLDGCDVIFEGGPGKCDEGRRRGVNFFLKLCDVIYGRPLVAIKPILKGWPG